MRTAADLQGLFDCYNKLYWQGRLPGYEVVVSTKYCGGFCEKRSRKIHLNLWRLPEDYLVSTLLHEMAHAAARGDRHGPTWQAEMKRLAKLGAPIDLKDSAPENRHSTTEILVEFEDAGREALDCPWPRVRRELGYELGLVDERGRSINRHAARILEKAKGAFCRGRKFAKNLSA